MIFVVRRALILRFKYIKTSLTRPGASTLVLAYKPSCVIVKVENCSYYCLSSICTVSA